VEHQGTQVLVEIPDTLERQEIAATLDTLALVVTRATPEHQVPVEILGTLERVEHQDTLVAA
jgi:hypothetical protein